MMRRTLLLIAALLISFCAFASNSYDKEFTFLGIAWGSDISAVKETLNEQGLSHYYGNYFVRVPDWDFKNQILLGMYETCSDDYGESLFCYSFENGFNIAGYSPDNISFHFLYDSASYSKDNPRTVLVDTIIYFNIHDPYEAYKDLKNKLTTLYGQPTTYQSSDMQYDYLSVWYGSNNTGIILQCSMSKTNKDAYLVRLTYGKTNTRKMIDSLTDVFSKIEQSNARNNYNGL